MFIEVSINVVIVFLVSFWFMRGEMVLICGLFLNLDFILVFNLLFFLCDKFFLN